MSAWTTRKLSFRTSDTARGNGADASLRFDSRRHAGTRLAARLGPRRALPVDAGEAVGVLVELAAADVLVGEVAADEAVLGLAAGDPADAAERRQEQEALVLGAWDAPRPGSRCRGCRWDS